MAARKGERLLKYCLCLFCIFIFLTCTVSLCIGLANNNTPSDAFETYQIALREENVNLLLQVYYIANSGSMSDSRLKSELKYLKRYDAYKNYTIYQVIDEGDIARVKVKGTLRGVENVRRTFKMKRTRTGWKITYVWNY